MNSMMVLVLGFITGSVIASGVWAVLWALSKSERQAQRSRVEAIDEIASECAEIENQLVTYSLKGMSETAFRSSISSRLEKITRLLSTNMHSFEIYYVKYIESLVARYRQALTGQASSEQTVAMPTLAEAIETDQALIATEAPPVPLEKELDLSIPSDADEKFKPEEKDKVTENKEPFVEREPDQSGDFVHGNFDQTWKMDFSKGRGEHEPFNKMDILDAMKDTPQSAEKVTTNETVAGPSAKHPLEETIELPIREKPKEPIPERIVSDAVLKDTKIIKTENISKEKQSEIENIIIAELNREPQVQTKETGGGLGIGKKEQPADAIGEFEVSRLSKPVEPQQQPKKNNKKEDKQNATSPQKDENFISGEDLVAKLDSFFGIKE
jgi:hypothetical protein